MSHKHPKPKSDSGHVNKSKRRHTAEGEALPSCPHCGEEFAANSFAAGTELTRCPICGKTFVPERPTRPAQIPVEPERKTEPKEGRAAK